MITIRKVYIGNSGEAYVQPGFTAGVNIISSTGNHVGKTIVMQSIMYALGSEAMFPPSFEHKRYVYIIDLEIEGRSVSILRNRNTFVVRDSGEIKPIGTVGDFDDYWGNNLFNLPVIIKGGTPKLTPVALYEQMAFVPQAKRSTSKTLNSYYDKKDFAEMIFSLAGLSYREIDTEELKALKNQRASLRERRKELLKQAKILKTPGSSLPTISPTADREQMSNTLKELDSLKDDILKLQGLRNRAYTRMKKNEGVFKELRSLNRNIEAGSLVCLDCGSASIGYSMAHSDVVFDLTTDDMRRQILASLQEKIDAYQNEANELDNRIRVLQKKFNAVADERSVTLADVFAAREEYVTVEQIDDEIAEIDDELLAIQVTLDAERQIDSDIQADRKEYREALVATMNTVRRKLNKDEDVDEYTDLFTTENKPYSGSEATEFFIARVYSLAKHVKHPLPILIDSFRAEELSTNREEEALPLFGELNNQVILTATIKNEEAGKYNAIDGINSIDFTDYIVNHLLSANYVDELKLKIKEFGIELLL